MRLGFLWPVFVSLGLGALAQEVAMPLPGNFLLPLQGPREFSPEGCRWHLGISLANHLSYAQGPWGEMGFDLEEIRLEPGVGYRVGPVEVSLYWPLSLYYGGFLDYVLDPLHQALGLPQNQVQGQVLLFARKGGIERRWEGPTLGLRDPYGRLDLYLGKGRLFLALGLPAGSVGRFMGAGGIRALVGAGWAWEEGEVRLGGIFPLGPQLGLEPFTYGPAVMAALRIQIPELPLALEAQGFWGPLRDAGEFSHGLTLRILYGPWGFSEDGSSGMPDVVFSWRESGLCPEAPYP